MNKDYIFMQQKEGIHLIPNAYAIARVYESGMKDVFGKSFGPTLVQYKDGVMYWYASQKCVDELARTALSLIKKDAKFLDKSVSKYKKLMDKLSLFSEQVYESDLTKLDSRELYSLFEKYLKLYLDAYPWSEPIVLGLSDSLGDYLYEYLENIIDDKKELARVYSILSAPREKSFVKEEEEDFLRLTIRVKNKKTSINEEIKKHTKKYFWVPYDYGLDIWDEKYFTIILEHILKQDEMVSRLEMSEKYFKELPQTQEALYKKYKINKKYRNLFVDLQRATYLQDYKKERFTLVHYYIVKLLEEIASRLNLSRELMQYYLPEELKSALLSGVILDEKELKSRYQSSLFIFENGVVSVVLGKEAEFFLAQHRKKEKNKNSILVGVTASAGCYRGKVRIINNTNEIKKIKKGDVLVAVMTSPDYVPAMRLAGAVVTDQGGIMCHAAILSRELGVPCIVGTGSATSFLTNGDEVEVNADQNVVKILK